MANTPLGFPFGFYVADNSPIDGKYGVIDAGVWRPYNDVAEALATLPLGARHIGLTVNIANVEYWWKNGVTDPDLIVKSAGITNSAANNELMKSDGTNAVPSGIFSTTAGNLTLGQGLSGTSRTIEPEGSGADVGLFLKSKGATAISLQTGMGGEISLDSFGGLIYLGGSTNPANVQQLTVIGIQPHIDISLTAKGAGNINLNSALLNVNSPALIITTSTATNTSINPLAVSHRTTATPAIGIGAGLAFEVETSASNNETGGIIQVITTDVTPASEDFDLVFRTMAGGAAAAERVRINNFGVGIGLTPTARLTLAAGTATVNTAPLKLTSGTALTTPENGALEYHSSHLYFTIGSTRFQLDQQGGGLSGLTTNRIPYATGATTLGDDSALTWDDTNDALIAGLARIHSRGTSNTFIGESSGNFTLTGTQNTSIGRLSMTSLTTGSQNVAIGVSALNGLTTGVGNVAIGRSAMSAANTTTATNNVAIGSGAASNTNWNGNQNVLIGASSGSLMSTSDNNVLIGFSTGLNLTTGGQNVLIGSQINIPSATGNGQLSIQNIIFGIGNTGTGNTVSTGNIGIGTPSPDRRFHAEQETATTNGITYVQRLTSTSSGTPANGIGVGLEFEAETANGTNEILATIEAVKSSGTGLTLISQLDIRTQNDPSGFDLGAATFRVGGSGRPTSSMIYNNAVSSVSYVFGLYHEVSGTPQVGVGVGLQFEQQTASGNYEVGATIEAVTTDVTPGSEDFDLVFKTMAAGAAANEKLRITSDGRLYGKALHNNAGAITGTTNQYIASGTYTPTLTNGTNVASSVAHVCQWIRVGNVVTVAGIVQIQATSSSTNTILRLSLPIPSNFSTGDEVGGVAAVSVGLGYGRIDALTGTDDVQIAAFPGSTGNLGYSFTFTYLIV